MDQLPVIKLWLTVFVRPNDPAHRHDVDAEYFGNFRHGVRTAEIGSGHGFFVIGEFLPALRQRQGERRWRGRDHAGFPSATNWQ